MKSKEYWAKRALQREDEAALRGTQLMEQVYDQYMKAAKEIQKNIDTFILKYGQKHGMTYNQAAAYLSKKEMQEWKKSLAEYVAEIKNASDNTQKGQLTARLDALSTNSSIRRLDALIGEIECILTGLCSDAEREAHKELGELFQDSYYKKVYDIQSRAGYINQFAHLDQKTVEDILSYPWSGANFSKRIWKNRDNLAFNLRETLTSGFIQGKSRTQMAKEMSDEMGKGFNAVETLIRTESSWLHGAADQRAYDVANIERYEFMATLDNRTSQKCANLDGKDFPVSEAQVGVNYPPMHPRCRSTTIEHDPEEASDWFKSGKEMPKNMTYKEWEKKQGIVKGLGSGKVGDKSKSSIIDNVSSFDYADKKALQKALKDFSKEKLNSGIEHAIVFSPDGKKYEISGMKSVVDITLAGNKAMEGAIVIHNHPMDGDLFGDCFSKADFIGFFEYGLEELYVVNHMGTYRMKFDERPFKTAAEAAEAYEKAFNIVRNRAFEDDNASLDYEQFETMKVLSKELKNMVFERVW